MASGGLSRTGKLLQYINYRELAALQGSRCRLVVLGCARTHACCGARCTGDRAEGMRCVLPPALWHTPRCLPITTAALSCLPLAAYCRHARDHR
jgi:hypothetical protein